MLYLNPLGRSNILFLSEFQLDEKLTKLSNELDNR